MLKIAISGICGKMGMRISELLKSDAALELSGALEAKNHPNLGKSVEGTRCSIESDIEKTIQGTDVLIEFTNPQTTLEHLSVVRKYRKSMVIGTTGLNEREIALLKEASLDIPVLFSPNMSVGVNLLFQLVAQAAKAVPGYDIEIIEIHHNQKKDAPSGTADKLARVVADTLGRDLNKTGVYGRKGIIGARKKDEIGVHAVRAGDVVGDHTVLLAGPGERIELVHRAHSRDTFAGGAIRAAKWLAGQKPGLYGMKYVLVTSM